jgi:hypothetical protein
MTKNAQQIALAKLDGWVFYPSKDNGYGQARPEFWQNEETGETVWENTPNFPNYDSRDVLIPLIQKLEKLSLRVNFLNKLRRILQRDLGYNAISDFDMLIATVKQLQEALLRATGLWKDE